MTFFFFKNCKNITVLSTYTYDTFLKNSASYSFSSNMRFRVITKIHSCIWMQLSLPNFCCVYVAHPFRFFLWYTDGHLLSVTWNWGYYHFEMFLAVLPPLLLHQQTFSKPHLNKPKTHHYYQNYLRRKLSFYVISPPPVPYVCARLVFVRVTILISVIRPVLGPCCFRTRPWSAF